jgi:hypothetical protein
MAPQGNCVPSVSLGTGLQILRQAQDKPLQGILAMSEVEGQMG